MAQITWLHEAEVKMLAGKGESKVDAPPDFSVALRSACNDRRL